MFPIARNNGLRVEPLSDELLVYDIDRHKAHCLSPTAAFVWQSCDGHTSIEGISARLQGRGIQVDREIVWVVLDRLSKLDLLQEKIKTEDAAINSTRRELIRKMAVAGGLAFLMTATIFAPTAARAASGGAQECGRDGHRTIYDHGEYH